MKPLSFPSFHPVHYLRFVLWLAVTVMAAPAVWAQKSEPANVYLFPAGGQRGTEVEVSIEGENVTSLCDFHVAPGHGVTAPPQARDRKIRLHIAPDAPLGPVPFRIATAAGGCGTRVFMVGQYPEIREREPGGDDPTPQPVSLPVTVNGRLNPAGDVDRFSFELKAGEPFHAEVTAARLGGAIDTNCFVGQFGNPPDDPTYKQLDATLELYGPDGRLLSQAEDTFGLDPALGFTAPVAGRYVVAVRHMAHLGMPQFVYRLTLAAAPLVTTAHTPERSEFPEAQEQEPNDTAEHAGALSLPGIASGRFQKPGDVDCYRVPLHKGESYRFEAWVQRLGSPTFAALAVLAPDGKSLALMEGSPAAPDPVLFFMAPADGTYVLQLRETAMSRLGDRLVYRLKAVPQPPDFEVSLKSEILDLSPGGSADVDVSLQRWGGFAGSVRISAAGLPEGVSAVPLELKAGQDKGKLHFTVPPGGRSGSWMVHVVGTGTIGAGEASRPATAPVQNPAELALGAAPATVDDLLLTVRFPAPFQIEADDSYLFLNLGTIYPAKIYVKRDTGFTEPILLTMADRQPRNPYGINFDPMTITGTDKEVFFPMRLPQGPRGNEIARVYVKGEAVTHDRDGREWHVLVTSPKQVVSRCIAPVLSLAVEPDAMHVKPGSTTPVRFRLGRTTATMGAAEVRLLSAEGMSGISMEPVTVGAGAADAVGTLRVEPSAVQKGGSELWFEVTSRRDNGQTVFYRSRLVFDLQNARP